MFLLRRIVGESMQPTLRPGRIVIAHRLFRHVQPGDVVVVMHQGLEKIKRIEKIRAGEVFIIGDNKTESTDSRDFGWLKREQVRAKVMWPKS